MSRRWATWAEPSVLRCSSPRVLGSGSRLRVSAYRPKCLFGAGKRSFADRVMFCSALSALSLGPSRTAGKAQGATASHGDHRRQGFCTPDGTQKAFSNAPILQDFPASPSARAGCQRQALSVPQIARRMGLTRQSVHATVNRLVNDACSNWPPMKTIVDLNSSA